MGDRWQVEVDRGVCIGSGMCVNHAPDGFVLDSARQSHPRTPQADANEPVLTAAEGCPVEAIMITLAATGEPVFPPGGVEEEQSPPARTSGPGAVEHSCDSRRKIVRRLSQGDWDEQD